MSHPATLALLHQVDELSQGLVLVTSKLNERLTSLEASRREAAAGAVPPQVRLCVLA